MGAVVDDPLGIQNLRRAGPPAALSSSQLAGFDRDGFLSPIRCVPPARALALRQELEATEREHNQGANNLGISHATSSWMHELVTTPEILDVVEDLIGPNILCRSSGWLVKESGSGSYIGWHQDAQYWGIRPDHIVTVWLACSEVTRASGPLEFAHGTHRSEFGHEDTHALENRLSRGQEIAEWGFGPDAAPPPSMPTTLAELRPGEACVFHVRCAHHSAPNLSGDRRLGIPIRYMPPSTRSILPSSAGGGASADIPMLVRGVDEYHHWRLISPTPPLHGFLPPHKVVAAAAGRAGEPAGSAQVQSNDGTMAGTDMARARAADAERAKRDLPVFLQPRL